MLFIHILFALLVGVIGTAILALSLRKRARLAYFLMFFFLLFLASWAGGVWLFPVGPPLWGVYWLPFVAVGAIFALLLAALTSPRPRRTTVELVSPEEERKEDEAIETAVGFSFWILVLVLIAAIVSRYVL